jgi:YNFM family putative membrane transporter
VAPPYHLSQTTLSFIFLAYILGIFVSSGAGYLVDRFGRRLTVTGAFVVMAVGVVVTLSGSLPLIVIGILMVTGGFFAAHATASGWVGPLDGTGKGHAAALYLLF